MLIARATRFRFFGIGSRVQSRITSIPGRRSKIGYRTMTAGSSILDNKNVIQKTIYYGTIVHSLGLDKLEIFDDTAVGVDEEGTIVFVDKDSKSPQEAAAKHGWDQASICKGPERGFFFPGFFDTHIHAPQYPNMSIFGKTTLLDWLTRYTFPLEASLSNIKKATEVYTKVIARTLSNGTTTACYYATVDPNSTNTLADIALKFGQRAFIGRCCMDDNSPDFYCDESTEVAKQRTELVIDHINTIDPEHKLVTPILTPRFAPSCTSELMSWLGKISKERDLPVQTHISENVNEIKWVGQLFPESSSYAGVYDDHGLLGPKTVLAHAIHLSKEEQDLILLRGAGISHCPTSNSCLGSGEAPIRSFLDNGMKVGLGSDVSGGCTPSILKVAMHSLLVSRHKANNTLDPRYNLSISEVLYLATVGGARVCNMAEKLGNFLPGKQWDAQMIDLDAPDSPLEHWNFSVGLDKTDELLANWVFNGDDRNVRKVWVSGNLVAGKDLAQQI